MNSSDLMPRFTYILFEYKSQNQFSLVNHLCMWLLFFLSITFISVTLFGCRGTIWRLSVPSNVHV